jgi:hypothetical protein
LSWVVTPFFQRHSTLKRRRTTLEIAKVYPVYFGLADLCFFMFFVLVVVVGVLCALIGLVVVFWGLFLGWFVFGVCLVVVVVVDAFFQHGYGLCFIGFLFEAKTILLLKEKPQGRIYMCARCFCTFFCFLG